MSVATTTMTPASKTDGFLVKVDQLHLDDIPGAMDKMGWKVAAQMMRHWFSIKPAYEMSGEVRDGRVSVLKLPSSQYNDTIVKMNWVLSFSRASEIYNELLNSWNSPAGIEILKGRLESLGWSSTKPTKVKLGSASLTAIQLDETSQVNFRRFGGLTDTLDDLYGAIGSGTFKLAVVGYSDVREKAPVFIVEKVGIYVRDTYDFNNNGRINPPLGVWSRNRILNKAETIAYYGSNDYRNLMHNFKGFVPVRNEDFRRWQARHNSGGDFLVFSDVKWVSQNLVIPL